MSDNDSTRLLTTSELLADTDATYRQIYHWVVNGWLKPHNSGAGSGTPLAWPPTEVEVAHQMARLVAAGLTVPAAHDAARNGGLLPGGAFRIEAAA
jgi:hypothetical protein